MICLKLSNLGVEKFITESGNCDFLSLIDICGLDRNHLESGEAIKKYIKQILLLFTVK